MHPCCRRRNGNYNENTSNVRMISLIRTEINCEVRFFFSRKSTCGFSATDQLSANFVFKQNNKYIYIYMLYKHSSHE